MHARELVELAAIVSAQGPVLVESPGPIPARNIEQYWTASKVRLDRWAWRLKRFSIHSGAADPADSTARRHWNRWEGIRGVLEEILAGEMLTRVWTAVLCAYDRRRGTDEAGPVARSVMIGQMEARHRVLMLMVHAPGIETEAAVKLNRLRGRVERWTDLLVGHLTRFDDLGEFAFDPQRASDFAEDLRCRGGRQAWPLLMASLRAAFRENLAPRSPNAELNARIAAAVMACFPSDLFDSTGLWRSLWLMRMTNVAEETQGKIDELLRLECPKGARGGGRGMRDLRFKI